MNQGLQESLIFRDAQHLAGGWACNEGCWVLGALPRGTGGALLLVSVFWKSLGLNQEICSAPGACSPWFVHTEQFPGRKGLVGVGLAGETRRGGGLRFLLLLPPGVWWHPAGLGGLGALLLGCPCCHLSQLTLLRVPGLWSP